MSVLISKEAARLKKQLEIFYPDKSSKKRTRKAQNKNKNENFKGKSTKKRKMGQFDEQTRKAQKPVPNDQLVAVWWPWKIGDIEQKRFHLGKTSGECPRKEYIYVRFFNDEDPTLLDIKTISPKKQIVGILDQKDIILDGNIWDSIIEEEPRKIPGKRPKFKKGDVIAKLFEKENNPVWCIGKIVHILENGQAGLLHFRADAELYLIRPEDKDIRRIKQEDCDDDDSDDDDDDDDYDEDDDGEDDDCDNMPDSYNQDEFYNNDENAARLLINFFKKIWKDNQSFQKKI
jgi:hypothetical protein